MGLFLLAGLLLSTEIYEGKDTDTETPPAHEQLRCHSCIDEAACCNLSTIP